jgi:hypothetical protein
MDVAPLGDSAALLTTFAAEGTCASWSDKERLTLPMTRDVMPLLSDLVPMIGGPVTSSFADPGAGYPMEETPGPFPIARRPRIAIAMRRLMFDARRRWRDITDDLRSAGRRRGQEQRARKGYRGSKRANVRAFI